MVMILFFSMKFKSEYTQRPLVPLCPFAFLAHAKVSCTSKGLLHKKRFIATNITSISKRAKSASFYLNTFAFGYCKAKAKVKIKL